MNDEYNAYVYFTIIYVLSMNSKKAMASNYIWKSYSCLFGVQKSQYAKYRRATSKTHGDLKFKNVQKQSF